MSAERCPECGAVGVECRCTPGVGFNPLRIRPYVALPDQGRAGQDPSSPQPVLGAVAQPSDAPDRPPFPSDRQSPEGPAGQGAPEPAPVPGAAPTARPGPLPTHPTERPGPPPPPSPHLDTPPNPAPAPPPMSPPAPAAEGAEGAATTTLPAVPPADPAEPHTPAYGIPVLAWPDQTVQLRAVPAHAGRAAQHAQAVGGGADRETGRQSRRLLPLLAGAGALVVAGAVAVALGFTSSGTEDRALKDPKPSAPAASVVPIDPTGPSEEASSPTPSPSASASRSASPSASRSASPSASPSTSRSSPPPSTTPSASASRSAGPSSPPPSPPAAQAPTLRYGDSGAEVEKLQRLLAEQGLYRGRLDGRFGRSVRSAVEDLQIEFGIHDDPWGVYGPATRRALEG
ncbi:peptidoglycan-binding protein [Streptomyces sp. NPDC054865]